MSEAGIRGVIEQRREWFYERNPLSSPVTWLAVDTTTGEIVGCASILPRRIRFDGELLTAGLMSDFVVSPKHRTAGPALIMQRALLEQSHQHGFALIYGYPNEKALPIFKRIGVKVVGNATSWHKPLRPRPVGKHSVSHRCCTGRPIFAPLRLVTRQASANRIPLVDSAQDIEHSRHNCGFVGTQHENRAGSRTALFGLALWGVHNKLPETLYFVGGGSRFPNWFDCLS